MKRQFLFLIISALFAISDAFAQTELPDVCEAFYPDVLQSSAVVAESDVLKVQAAPYGQKKSGRKQHWIVYSDRDDNTTYTSPGGSEKFSTLNFNQRLRIAKIQDGYALVYTEEQEDIAYPQISQYAETKGWVSMKKLLLWHTCPANEAGIFNKALLCVNLDSKTGADLGRIYRNPENRNKFDQLVTDMNFYYVMKREGNLSLLARTHNLYGHSDQMLEGWVSEESYVAWNQRSCLEPTWDKDDVEYFASEGVKAVVFKEDDLAQRVTTLTYKTKASTKHDPELYRMHPDFLRFPLLDGTSDELYNCSAFTTAGGKSVTITNDDGSYLTNSEKLLRERTNINIGILIDGTSSMKEFYEPVKNAIKESVRFFGKKYKVQVGVMIYRDYHDGDEFVTEKFPMTSPENRKLMEFLDSGGKYDIKSARSDKTYEEALYLGIERAIDELGFRQNQTNILLVVGDCGNDLKDKEVSQQELIDKLVAKDINIMGFQVRRMQHNAFELFNDQIITLMKSSLERKYKALDDKVSVKLAETKDGYKLVNSHSSILYVGSHYYPEMGEVMEESKLTSLIEEAVSFCSTSVEHQVDIWARHNTGTGFRTNKTVVNSELDLDQEWLKQRLGDDYERIKNSNSLLAVQGYVKKTHESGREYFKPVVFISSDEFNTLLTRLAQVNDAAVEMSSDREPYINALKALMQTMAPDEFTDEVVGEMNYKQIMSKIAGLNERAAALKGYTLKEIASPRAVPDVEYQKLISGFKHKFRRLENIKKQPYKYTRTFNGLKYYWIPIEALP